MLVHTLLLAQMLATPSSQAPDSALPAAPPSVHHYLDLAIDPKGQHIASIDIRHETAEAVEPHGAIVLRDVTSGRETGRIDPCSQCRYSDLAWSPDGTELVFVATDETAGTASIEVAAGTTVRALTSVQGVVHAPRYAPDGRSIAVLATVAARKRTGALEAAAPQVGEIGAAPDEQRIGVVARNGGELRLVSPSDTYVYEYDWLPDGRGFVGTAAHGDGDNNWWIAELARFDLATGAMRRIAKPDYQMSFPRVAPDGHSVQFIGGLMSDFGAVGGDLYEVSLDGGTPTNLTPGYAGSFSALYWRGGRLYATGLRLDESVLIGFDSNRRNPMVLWGVKAATRAADGDMAIANDGHFAAALEDFAHPPHIVAGTSPDVRQITHDNDALIVDLNVQSLIWKSDEYFVQGWLVGPAHPTDGKHPLIVHVHGGPSSAALPTYGSDYSLYTAIHEWVDKGYYLLLPNPRGSYGQGEAFAAANRRDFGGGDLRDILAGVDAAERVAPIDDARIGLHGHSYGGFMTMWALTQTHRFRAAIAGAGLSNWISYYGTNGIDTWMLPFIGASVYDDPAPYHAMSAIEHMKNVTTPVLLYTGESDVEVPASQSFEYWHALKTLGVPVQLHVYPGEGHLVHKPEHVLDLRRRLPAWFDQYLKP